MTRIQLKKLVEERKRWEETTVAKVISKAPERKKKFETFSGIEIKRCFLPSDVEELDYEKDLGFPGEYPFTRGVQPTMYRGRFFLDYEAVCRIRNGRRV